MRLNINGVTRILDIDPRVTLLDALREYLGFTGTKKGCDRGECGACTVLVNGRRINSCLTLAIMHEGAEITTIEGLAADGAADSSRGSAPMPALTNVAADSSRGSVPMPALTNVAADGVTDGVADGQLHPMQAAFIAHDGFQCGYCTSGQIVSAVGMLSEMTPTCDAEIRKGMSGNLCRCGAYSHIVAAIKDAIAVEIPGFCSASERDLGEIAEETGDICYGSYTRSPQPESAIATLAENPNASFIAGGTDLLALMKNGLRSPDQLVDINAVPLATVDVTETGVKIGAIARMSDVANHPMIKSQYPVLCQALLESASPQIRNMASVGGNLMQRVRCGYFRDPVFPCNRRVPGTGCSAISGYNRQSGIFGTSEHCIAVHPSDFAVALTALDATICTQGTKGDRRIPIDEFYLLPGDTPDRETILEHGELIVAIELPASPFTRNSTYLKVRDRASYEFALVSVALALEIENNMIKSARVAFGGVAPKPWRSDAAEAALIGQPVNQTTFTAAAEAAVRGAKPQEQNQFKIPMLKGALIRALKIVGGAA